MLIGAVGLWQTRRKRDIAELGVLAVVLWQAISHIRHLPFLAMLFGFWLPVHLDSWLKPVGQALANPLSTLAASADHCHYRVGGLDGSGGRGAAAAADASEGGPVPLSCCRNGVHA